MRRGNYLFLMTFFIMVLLCAVMFAPASHARSVDGRYGSIVTDAKNNTVLHAYNSNKKLYPASLTKVMTLYLLFDELKRGKLKLNSRLKVSAYAARQEPSKLGLRRGQTISVKDAIMALITRSANDVAVVVAETLAKNETQFARKMTKKAKSLGMKRTNYRNASGLPHSKQVSTPRDQATLARALINNHGKYYHYFSTATFRYRGKSIRSHNRVMLRYKGADGIKTGYIRAAGFNLMASAKRDGKRVIAVVFGGPSSTWRDSHVEDLFDLGFSKVGVAPIRTTLRVKAPRLGNLPRRAVSPPSSIDSLILAIREEEARTARVNQPLSEPWAVQVGAYRNRNSARKVAGRAIRNLGGNAEVKIDPVKRGGMRLYRAQVVNLTKDQAHRACKRVSRAGRNNCQIIQPKS